MQKNINKINLRDIDIDMIVTSASFQKKLTDTVQIIIINMGKKEYSEAVKKSGSEKGLIENIKKSVLTKMINKITNKLFWGSSIAITGILSTIGISNIDGNTVNLDDIDWSDIDWSKIDWSEIEIEIDWSEIEILEEGLSNFVSWIKGTASEWIDDLDY